MQMASEQNLNYGLFSQSFCNQNVVSFQTGMVNSTSSEMLPVTPNESIDSSSRIGGLTGSLNASSSIPVNTNLIGTSNMICSNDMSNPGGLVVDQSHLKYGSSISVEWSQQELAVLRDGLARHANDQSIMKYVKIAARLPEKTVRDVAMRCQWMMRRETAKRRKADEYSAGRKMKDTKDLAVESTLWAMNYPGNLASQSNVGTNTTYSNQISCGDSVVDRAMRQVLDENNRLLSQIASNIATSQSQSNIELFNRTRRNINIMLQSVNQFPNVLSNMPPIPISPNERLANLILPNINLANCPTASQLNAKPQGW